MVEIDYGDEPVFVSAPVFVDGKVRVHSEKCTTCVFRPGNLMHLSDGVLQGLIDATLTDESQAGNIPCHDTLYLEAGAICRGWWDGYADKLSLFQMAKRMGIVIEIPPPEKEK